jgi:hypothetical protein
MEQNDQAFNDAQLAATVPSAVAAVHAEIHSDESHSNAVNFDSEFERDVGFDSLARADLSLPGSSKHCMCACRSKRFNGSDTR